MWRSNFAKPLEKNNEKTLHKTSPLTLAQAQEIILRTLNLNAPPQAQLQIKPILLLGTPGIGKTSLVLQTAKELERRTGHAWPVLKLRLSELLPEDFLGIPVTKDGQTRWYPPATLPHRNNPELPDHGVLFFDEINRANRMVLNAVMKVLDRDDFKPGWIIIAAGNLGDSDGTLVEELDAAQRRRFLVLHLKFRIDGWLQWAEQAGVDPLIRQFLEKNPNWACHAFQEQSGVCSWITPAHWAELSAMKGANPDLSWEDFLTLIGKVHLGPAFPAFWDFVTAQQALSVEDFFNLSSPDQAAVEAASRKILQSERPERHGFLEKVLENARVNKCDPERMALSLSMLLSLDVVDIDSWMAFLRQLMALQKPAVKRFCELEPAFTQRLAQIWIGLLTQTAVVQS